MAMNSLNRFADPVYCIMRLIIGLMFACHGGQKLLGFPGGGHGGAEGLMFFGGIIELVGGLMIAFGFLTRLAAFVSAVKWRWLISWCTPRVKQSVMRRRRPSNFFQF